MTNKVRWTRLVAEGGVIVLSILLAFGIDAWWQGQVERAAEEAAVEGIRRDFEAYGSLITGHMSRYSERMAAAEELLGAVGPSEGNPDFDVVRAMGVVGIVDEVRLRGGALESLASGPGLSIVRDPALRGHLEDWGQALEKLATVNAFVTEEARRYLDFLADRYSLQDLDRAIGMIDLPPSGFEVDLGSILADIGFANVLYQQYYASRVMVGTLNELAAIGVETLTQIERGR